jgi:ribosomal protein L4
MVISKKFADSEVIFVESLGMTAPKAKDAKATITALAKGSGEKALAGKRKNAALVLLSGRNEAIELSFRNFGNLEVMQAKDVSPVDLLTYKYVVVAAPTESLAVLSKRVAATAKTA